MLLYAILKLYQRESITILLCPETRQDFKKIYAIVAGKMMIGFH
jgi:hypothetical protein